MGTLTNWYMCGLQKCTFDQRLEKLVGEFMSSVASGAAAQGADGDGSVAMVTA